MKENWETEGRGRNRTHAVQYSECKSNIVKHEIRE